MNYRTSFIEDFCFKDEDYKNSDLYRIFHIINPDEREDIWLAGGCIRQFIQYSRHDTDIDVFASSKEKLQDALNNFLTITEKIPTHSIKWIKDGTYILKTSAFSFRIQFVSNYGFYPTIEELLDSFDFTICQFGLAIKNKRHTIYIGQGGDALRHLYSKLLVINKILYPVSSLRRIIKYTKKGFFMSNNEMQKFLTICKDQTLSSNPLNDY